VAIDANEVRRIAALARLELDSDELERAARELSGILALVETLRRLDLTGCEPGRVSPEGTALRDDVPDGRTLTRDVALAAAPAAEQGFFLVPPIVENVNP
jgi:aspartyl-tRNA(Asn)/glutamyl-tRNA(Gln) amidotransferase subunit C